MEKGKERERVRARARERVKAHEGLQKLDVQLKLTNSNRLPCTQYLCNSLCPYLGEFSSMIITQPFLHQDLKSVVMCQLS